MAWGSKQNATQLTSITTEVFFDTVVELNPGEWAVCEVEYNPVASPTDNLVVSVYGTMDASSENWDDTPIHQFEIDKAIDPNKASFAVPSQRVRKFRVGVKRSGTTDTITSADFSYQKSGLNL